MSGDETPAPQPAHCAPLTAWLQWHSSRWTCYPASGVWAPPAEMADAELFAMAGALRIAQRRVTTELKERGYIP